MDLADRDEVRVIANRWGIGGVWQTNVSVADALLFGGPAPSAMRLWARDLQAVRGRTVAEDHLRRWAAPFWALPLHRAIPALLTAISEDLTPAHGETVTNKVRRSRLALRHPFQSHVEHQRAIGPEGVQPRHRRR